MAGICEQCGAAVADQDAFCTKCGARREGNSGFAAAQRFCTKCGAALENGTKFCTKCSATAGMTVPDPASASPESKIGASVGADSKSARPFSSSVKGIPKFAILAIGVVLLMLIVSLFYGVHRARQKAAQIAAAENFEQNLEIRAAGGRSAGQEANQSSSADFNKNLAELQAAANALGQDAQKTGATAGSSSGSNGSPSSDGSGGASGSAPVKAPYGWTLENGKLVPAKPPSSEPPPLPKADPVVPVAATGNQAHDWALKYERTENGPEADLVVRTGDINNLGFGWPQGFDPFSGESTPPHQWPEINKIPPGAPDGTDRIMLGSAVIHGPGDGYSGALSDCIFSEQVPKEAQNQTYAIKLATDCKREHQLTAPTAILLPVGALPAKIDAVLIQLFADDFQPVPMHSHFLVSLNGTRIPTFEYAINALDQSGPIGKLLTLKLLPEYWPLLRSGTVRLLIDDPTTHVADGYAVDFVRILVNPHNFKYQVSLAATVTDADKHTPIAGATVAAGLDSAATDRHGRSEMKGIPAGLVVVTANAPGYDENSVPVDLPAGQRGNIEIQLHRHQETSAALEKSIEETGSATIYGIHFDTDSAKLRADSLPALNAVLGLVKNHLDSRWTIAGHTDNQGSATHNQPLSEARAKSVVTWLKEHGVDVNRLIPQGFGATRPVADNSTANGRFLNRRVEVSLAK